MQSGDGPDHFQHAGNFCHCSCSVRGHSEPMSHSGQLDCSRKCHHFVYCKAHLGYSCTRPDLRDINVLLTSIWSWAHSRLCRVLLLSLAMFKLPSLPHPKVCALLQCQMEFGSSDNVRFASAVNQTLLAFNRLARKLHGVRLHGRGCYSTPS